MKDVPQWIAISDLKFFDGKPKAFIDGLQGVLALGLQAVMVRDKDVDSELVEELLRDVSRLRRSFSFQLLLNLGHVDQFEERIEWASRYEVDGVHLPDRDWNYDDLRSKLDDKVLLGQSTHEPDKLEQMEGVLDYALVSPIFLPQDKTNSNPLGFSGLREAVRNFSPVIALGGISEENLSEMIQRGAYGVAFRLRRDRAEFYQALSRTFL